MKPITNFLIIFLLLFKLSTSNAQIVWNRIESHENVTLPLKGSNNTYNTGIGTTNITNDCIALKFNISSTDLSNIKSNPGYAQILFGIKHIQKNNSNIRISFSVFLKYSEGKFEFIISRYTDLLYDRKIAEMNYTVGDIIIPSSSTGKQYFGLLLSDYGGVLWQNASANGKNIRTAPLFFGYPSNYLYGLSKNIGVIDYLKYDSNSNYKLFVQNFKVEDFVLRKPKSNFHTLAKMILENTTNPILNQRLSGENSDDEETISIDEFSENLKLYPNPSNGQFTVDLQMTEPGNVNFEIYNMNGQKVFEQKQVEFFEGSTTHHIDTQNILTPGVYFLNVSAPNFTKKTQLIIK